MAWYFVIMSPNGTLPYENEVCVKILKVAHTYQSLAVFEPFLFFR